MTTPHATAPAAPACDALNDLLLDLEEAAEALEAAARRLRRRRRRPSVAGLLDPGAVERRLARAKYALAEVDLRWEGLE